jgi:RNA polymerase sigma factor (TIGR02999 family)
MSPFCPTNELQVLVGVQDRLTKTSETYRFVCSPELSQQEAYPSTTRVLRPQHAGGMLSVMSDVTRILSAIEQGDAHAAEQLLPLVYDELRKLAAHKLAQEKPGQTLEATALVHEAYVRLVDTEKAPQWSGRGHFFAAAAEAMRRILVDQARRKLSLRHGGNLQRRAIEDQEIAAPEPSLDVLAVHEALERFQQVDASAAQIVKLRYFAGLTIPQAAEALGISTSTADRTWAYARAWLHTALKQDRTKGGAKGDGAP